MKTVNTLTGKGTFDVIVDPSDQSNKQVVNGVGLNLDTGEIITSSSRGFNFFDRQMIRNNNSGSDDSDDEDGVKITELPTKQ